MRFIGAVAFLLKTNAVRPTPNRLQDVDQENRLCAKMWSGNGAASS